MSIKRSLILNSVAGILGKVSGLLTRIATVPIFLSALGTSEYGNWIVLSSLLSWLSIANLGLGSVGANEMSMAMANADIERARIVLSSAINMVFRVIVCALPIVVFVAYYLPWPFVLGVDAERKSEIAKAVIFLAVPVFLSFIGGIYSSRFMAVGKAHLAIHFANIRPWMDILASAIALNYSNRFDVIALSLSCSAVLHTALLQFFSLYYAPGLTFSRHCVDIAMTKNLLRLGLAFQAFPIGNALIFQGFVFVVQLILGSQAVVLFSTARTLVRSANQAMEFVNQVVWPEMAGLIGRADYSSAAKLHRLSVFISCCLAVLMTLSIGLFGTSLFRIWTGGQLALPRNLLWFFLAPIPLNAIWYTSSVVHVACNRHETFAKKFLMATVISLFCSIPLTYVFGLTGTAVSTVIVDILLIRFVLHESIKITLDSRQEFTMELLNFPLMLARNVKSYFIAR